MIEIQDLLSRFREILHKGESKKLAILEIIMKVTNMVINPKEVEIKNNILYLRTKPIIRNEIILKKELILLKLKKELGSHAVNDIQ